MRAFGACGSYAFHATGDLDSQHTVSSSSVHQLRLVWMSLSRGPAAAGQFTVQNDGSGILTGSHCLVRV